MNDILCSPINIINYTPDSFRAIQENAIGLGSYYMRPEASCDTNPNH